MLTVKSENPRASGICAGGPQYFGGTVLYGIITTMGHPNISQVLQCIKTYWIGHDLSLG